MRLGRKKRRIERVLVVEDEPLVAFDTEHFLTGEGFTIVATVDTVADAMAAMNEDGEIDLVLVDVRLSDGSGVDVAQEANARGIQVLFVTGNCPGEARTLAAGCLAKPYPQRDLLAAIAAVEAISEGQSPKRLPTGLKLFASAA